MVRSLSGTALVNHLASTESVNPAVSATWGVGTSLLNDQGGAMIFYGLFIVIGAWLAGPVGIARSTRRAITPILERRLVGYSALALILILLFVWAPTPGFHRLPTALLLIVLSIIGLEFLRHRAIADFPDQTWEAGVERSRRGWQSVLSRRDSRKETPKPGSTN